MKTGGDGITDVQSGGEVAGANRAIGNLDGYSFSLMSNGINVLTVNSDGTISVAGNVDGRDISTDGSNLDSHRTNTGNPHSVTKSQVGLANVTNNAQMIRGGNDFSSFNSKASLVSSDYILVEDSADSFNKKRITLSAVSHSLLSGIGSNSHSQLDSHVGSTSNPHSVTKTQVGLGNVPNLDCSNADNIEDGVNKMIPSHEQGQTWAQHVLNTSNPHSTTKSQVGLGNVDNLQQIPLTQKGAVSGVCELDSSGKVPSSRLSVSALTYKGGWNVSTNTPALSSSGGGGIAGDYYVVSVAGTRLIDGNSDWQIKDWIMHNGSTWDKIDNTDSVTSVAGRQGAVVLTKSDVGLSNVPNTDCSNADNISDGITKCIPTVAQRTAWNNHVSSTSNPHNVTKTQIGLGNVENKLSNFSATTAPSATDDGGDGYSIGSFWVNLITQKVYVCVDATISNAKWSQITEDVLYDPVYSRPYYFGTSSTTNAYLVGAGVQQSRGYALYYYMWKAGILSDIAVRCEATLTNHIIQVRLNGATVSSHSMTNATNQYYSAMNVAVTVGQRLSVYISGTSSVNETVEIFFKALRS